MGTDIHLYIERQKEDGAWERVRPAPWECSWCEGTGTGANGQCYNCDGRKVVDEEYGDRNYRLFGMLADVRNGTGFADCDTGDGFAPMAPGRGIPKDTTIKTNEDYDDDDDNYVWLGDHSYSWCTLAEALAYDYDRVAKLRGTVNAPNFALWCERGRKGPPESYSGGCSGPGVQYVSNEEMQKLILAGVAPTEMPKDEWSFVKSRDGKCHFTVVEWEQTYRECAGKAWFAFLEVCRGLGDPERVRFVFGFDS